MTLLKTRAVTSVVVVGLLAWAFLAVLKGTGRIVPGRVQASAVEFSEPAAGVFDPFNGLWSDWPQRSGKPVIGLGDNGDAVLYLQSVLDFKANAWISIDGTYGTATEAAVGQLQAFFNLPVTGVADEATWSLVDFLAMGN